MWKLLPLSPQLEKKLRQLLWYISKICPKNIGQSSINWAIVRNKLLVSVPEYVLLPLLKCPLLTVQRVFKLVRFYFCRNNKRRKVDFPIQEKFSSLGDNSLIPLLVLKKNLLSKGSHIVFSAEIRECYNLIVTFFLGFCNQQFDSQPISRLTRSLT